MNWTDATWPTYWQIFVLYTFMAYIFAWGIYVGHMYSEQIYNIYGLYVYGSSMYSSSMNYDPYGISINSRKDELPIHTSHT